MNSTGTTVQSELSGFEPTNLGLFILGFLVWPHMLVQRDNAALTLAAVSTLIAVKIYQSNSGLINDRYFLTLFFFIVPMISLGLTQVLRWSYAMAARFKGSVAHGQTALITIVLLIVLLGWGDALTSTHQQARSS